MPGKIIIAIVGIIFISIGISIAISGNNLLKDAKASSYWPKIKGQITLSEIEQCQNILVNTSQKKTNRQPSITYSAKIRYKYTIGNKQYSSDKISFSEYRSSELNQIHNIINRYPKGKTVTIYYHPNNHEYSVLEPGADSSAYVPLILGIFFSFSGVLIILLGILGRKYI